LARKTQRRAPVFYSHLKATSGSTFAARRAGTQQATSVTTISNAATPANTNGSVALTPISRVRCL
jgi:hypothetical protein